MVQFYNLQIRPDDSEVVALRDVNVVTYLTSFFSETTFQGFPGIVRNRSIFKKLFWLACVLASAYALYWELGTFFDKFLRFQASTTVSVEAKTSLDFPAVTICNNNAVNQHWAESYFLTSTISSTSSITNTSSTTAGTTKMTPTTAKNSGSSSVDSCGKSTNTGSSGGSPSPTQAGTTATTKAATTISTNGASSVSVLPSVATILEAAGQLSYPNKTTAGHQRSDVILSCKFNGEDCDVYTNFSTWHWSPTYGSCWTYNFGYKKANSPLKNDPTADLWRLKQGNGDGIKRTSQAGGSHGLYLQLYTDSTHYLSDSQSAGWRILVHNQTEMPFPDEAGLFVMPGTSTYVGVKRRNFKHLGRVDNGLYTVTYRDCVTNTERYTDKYTNYYSSIMEVGYSTNACLKSCYQKNVVATCGCFDYNYPYDYTDTSVIACNSQNSKKWSCKESVWNKYITNNLNCYCPDNCESYTYSTTLSILKWPIADRKVVPGVCESLFNATYKIATSDEEAYVGSLFSVEDSKTVGGINCTGIMQTLQECVKNREDKTYDFQTIATETIGDDFGQVYVFMENLEYESFVENEIIEVGDLIAYLGGIIGLFFGFTMLTLCEYILLVVDLIVIGIAKVYYSCRGKEVPSAHSNFRWNSRVQVQPTKVPNNFYDSKAPNLSADSRPSHLLYNHNTGYNKMPFIQPNIPEKRMPIANMF